MVVVSGGGGQGSTPGLQTARKDGSSREVDVSYEDVVHKLTNAPERKRSLMITTKKKFINKINIDVKHFILQTRLVDLDFSPI